VEILLFQVCLPFVPPPFVILLQMFNDIRKIEIVADNIFFGKIVEKP
jgi:hypothetical protein